MVIVKAQAFNSRSLCTHLKLLTDKRKRLILTKKRRREAEEDEGGKKRNKFR